MPNLSDNLKIENDRTYTPYEANRRSAMRLKPGTKLGFFRVADGPILDPICSFCILPIIGPHMRVNGIDYHNQCAFKS